MKNDPDRQILIEQVLQRFKKKLEQEMPDDNATLDQIEEAVDKVGKEVLRDLQEQLTNQRAKKPRNNQIDCACGGRARYRNLDTKILITRNGLLRWSLPYYYCSSCHKGTAPLDATLGLDQGETTTRVREWAAFLAPNLSFELSAETLARLRDVHLSAATIERIAVGAGTKLGTAQREEALLHHQDRLPDRRTSCPSRLYIGADGVMMGSRLWAPRY